jgi:replicative DNA helicase
MQIEQLYSPEPEMAVLNLVLNHPDSFFELNGIKPGMFSSTAHQVIFTSLGEMIEQGNTPDHVSLGFYLKSKGKDAVVGGTEYLQLLAHQEFPIENLKMFEQLVVDGFKARSISQLAVSIPESIRTGKDVEAVIAGIRSRLDGLTSASGGEMTSDLSTVMKSSLEELGERIKNPGIKGITTGIHSLDTVTGGLNPGELWFIAGRPGMGKTAQMCNMMLAQGRQGVPSLMFSYEMQKNQLAERLLSLDTGINSFNIRLGTLSAKEFDAIKSSAATLRSLPIHVDTNTSGDLNYVITTTRKYVRMNDVKVMYLDYIQLAAERTKDATNELGQISRRLKLLAGELGITVIVGSQFNRALELREDKRPQLADLRQSGNLEEDADVVLGMYRDVMYNKNTKVPALLENIILKQRSGPRGMLPLSFDENTGRIGE